MLSVDVAIVGAGFGGSLLALVLQRAGLRVALIDRGKHPRFAIGESSTPIANLVLRDLCREYDLPNIAPLAKYGSWQVRHPQLTAGIKRGFSYFSHQADRPFVADVEHSTELLVAASSRDESADTHWLRQDVDAFLFREAATAGVFVFEETQVMDLAVQGESIELQLSQIGPCRARFVVDASGEAGWLPKRLGIEDRSHEMRTNSRTVFAHFAGVKRWREHLQEAGVPTDEHPFDCDHAALHHVFDGGWMWQLRFNDESVSAGFVLTDSITRSVSDGEHSRTHGFGYSANRSPSLTLRVSEGEALWDRCLARFPSIADQFSHAKIIRPESGLRITGRLQRKWAQAAGPWWALLPNTAGFVDPLHSTGIAHTLCGIERLAQVLIHSLGRDEFSDQLRHYDTCVLAELDLIDQLVSGCFLGLGEFRLFGLMSMLYFAAATSYERLRLGALRNFAPAFLLADDPTWRDIIAAMHSRARTIVSSPEPARRQQLDELESELVKSLAPYNRVGLCDRSLRNMYRHSALPE